MTSELDVYYLLNYSLCSPDTSFLANYHNLSLIAHILSMVLLPFYVFGGYCILFKTPQSMRQVKWPLFNVFFWCTCMDFMATSLITPYFYFPALSGFCLGILGQLGIPTPVLIYIGAFCIWAMILSVSALFEDRFNSIPANEWRIKRRSTKIIYHSLRNGICLFYNIPFLIFSPDQGQAKLETLRIVPCPTPEFFTAPIYTFLSTGSLFHIATWMTLVLAMFEAAQVIFFGSYCLYFLHFYPVRFISVRTRRLQAGYFYGIVIQISVSGVSLVVPFLYFIFSIILGYHNQAMTNFCVLFFAIHGFLATVVVVLIHGPYRNFAKSCLSCDNGNSVSTRASSPGQVRPQLF